MTPAEIIALLQRAAPTPQAAQFTEIAIRTYFDRVTTASWSKLIAYGLRPVVAPIAAEFALDRADRANAQTLEQLLTALIAEDEMVADLTVRAVLFYARRFAVMDNLDIESEIGVPLSFDANTAACRIWINLQCIWPTPLPADADQPD